MKQSSWNRGESGEVLTDMGSCVVPPKCGPTGKIYVACQVLCNGSSLTPELNREKAPLLTETPLCAGCCRANAYGSSLPTEDPAVVERPSGVEEGPNIETSADGDEAVVVGELVEDEAMLVVEELTEAK